MWQVKKAVWLVLVMTAACIRPAASDAETGSLWVDLSDFTSVAGQWLAEGCGEPNWCGGADLNEDGVVSLVDLQEVTGNWLAVKRLDEGQINKPCMASYYVPYENPIEPQAPGYTLPLDLQEVVNFDQMGLRFDLAAVEPLLESNGWAVMEYRFAFPEVDRDDIVAPYECLKEMDVPIFVTSDTLLHLYHIQFDETLKEIEQEEFCADIAELTTALLDDALAEYEQFSGDLKEAARRNVAYLAVAQKLIDPQADVPPLVQEPVAAELARIEAHAGFAASNIFIYEEDYSQYVPRGHYTQSEQLKRYFKTLMWYGRMAMLLKGAENWGVVGEALISVYDAKIQTMQAVLLADSLQKVQAGQRTGLHLWQRIYAITAFYVGLADDLTPMEYLAAVEEVFGQEFVPAEMLDEEDFFALKVQLSLLRSPKIFGGTGNPWVVPPITDQTLNEVLEKTKGMRFMGQRFVPDSYMFQQLVFPQVLDYTGTDQPFTLGFTGVRLARCYPRGLDVMAMLGSTQAKKILTVLGDTDYVNYDKQFNMLKAQFDQFDVSDWNQNLYWGWLYSLVALVQPAPAGYPNFMRTEVWETKQLNAALASWTELRHDTILYAKQSYTPRELGVPNISGYVEPVPEFYARLLALTQMTREGLSNFDALSTTAEQRLVSLEQILSRLIELANKELTGQPLSEADQWYIVDIVESLERTVIGVNDQGASTALVADVHTHSFEQKVVEEGTGYVDLIFVACQNAYGDIFLAAGPVLSYYEFKHPMSDRLTDEAWRQILASPDRPARPKWYQPFVHE